MLKLGSDISAARSAKIIEVNSDGTVRISLDEGTLTKTNEPFSASFPAAWLGSNGQFFGGYPVVGSAVSVIRGQGNEWFIIGYLKSNNVFTRSFISSDSNLMSVLKEGRALIQVTGGNHLFIDPNSGIHAGNNNNSIQINPNQNILSNNFDSNFTFTEASRTIEQIVKRDLFVNKSRNVLGSTLESHFYDRNLLSIGMDPDTSISIENSGQAIRNPPFVEKREIVYEFARSFNFTTDADESANYLDSDFTPDLPKVNRKEMRSDALSLSLEYPNHLIETIKGTSVDIYGNILDINRNILPIGQIESLSLRKNQNKDDAFDNIRKQLRKSVAFSFEINSRKETFPDVSSNVNYARDRSRFSFQIDKEGQFKLNIPASSEIGNIPLLTRHENYSVLLANDSDEVHPNEFVVNEERKDIFLENFANISKIGLSSGDHDLDGYASPIDRFTENVIKYGTAHHDILNVCSEFTDNAAFKKAGNKLITISDNHPLNATVQQLPKIISDLITVSGPNANAGGRSGSLNLDGFISISLGANTIDRQSLWLDTAGGIVSSIGRDKRGISYAANLSGDMIVQIGGIGIEGNKDSRFASEDESYRNGTFDLRVLANGQMYIIRIDETGMHFTSPGRMTFHSQQSMVFHSNSDIKMEAENIVAYSETSKRIIKRFPATTIG